LRSCLPEEEVQEGKDGFPALVARPRGQGGEMKSVAHERVANKEQSGGEKGKKGISPSFGRSGNVGELGEKAEKSVGGTDEE